MASFSTNEFKAGLKVMLDGNPCAILENEFVKPGKGQAFNRVKLRNLRSGKVLEQTFKSGDSLEAADVMDTEMNYLYNDGEFWHFMHPESFEQIQADKTAMLYVPSLCLMEVHCRSRRPTSLSYKSRRQILVYVVTLQVVAANLLS